ncbi:hypothetical protein [Marinoscillum sp.]|uniref:hypothetical protein n=1 Tax=Marinoscillum sp. TaxID=2024838 RepID=UPI003BAC19A9
MDRLSQYFPKVLVALFIAVVLAFIFFHFQGYSSSIGWNVTTTAESEAFYTLPFKKGPFQFSFQGEKYTLAENFSAGPIERHFTTDAVILSVILLGLCLMLTVTTYLSRMWFIGIMGLFIFFIMNLHLPEVRLFGFGERSSVAVVIILVIYLLPAYLFHAFIKGVDFGWRLLSFVLLSVGVIIFAGVETIALQEQFIAGSYFGMIALALIFLFLIAEENVFAILYLITQSKGGRSNHVHFSVFSFVYLGILIAHYGKKAGFWNLDIAFFSPYLLLTLSALVALWSLKFKRSFFEGFISVEYARVLYCSLGMVVIGFLTLAFSRGNDPVYEGLHYFIVYAHLAFGTMFFLYLFWNFVSPLGQGMQVYKIAYKSQSFPYVSARLAGLAAIAAFFFLANKEPFLLFRAGHYNYLGAQAEVQGQDRLAAEYYREGMIYGYDNHFSNYKIGYRELQKGDISEANYRFGRAALRYPSPQTFVNQSATAAMNGETTPSLISLQNGLRAFPDNNQLLNNLGLTYADMGKTNEAVATLLQAQPESQWTNAAQVNLWKVRGMDSAQAEQDYEAGNLAVKANILSALMDGNVQTSLSFDSTSLFPSYPLHRLTFLINAAWYFEDGQVARWLDQSLSGQLDERMYWAGRNAMVMSHFKAGQINSALQALDFLKTEVPAKESGKYLNQMGLIALSQHAPEVAIDHFEKAIDAGYEDALLNKAACLLELGEFSKATEWATYLVALDSGYSALKKDIQNLNSTENLTPDQQLFRLYYLYSTYSPGEVNALLSQADEQYIRSLWAKVANEQLEEQNYEQLKTYRAVFNSLLPAQYFEEPDALLALADGSVPQNDHTLSKILAFQDPGEQVSALVSLAGMNSLNEPLVLAISKILRATSLSESYDVLVKAINFNPRSVALHQQYIMAALEMGLENYANDAMQKLTTLTTQNDYQLFYQQYLDRKKVLDTSGSW